MEPQDPRPGQDPPTEEHATGGWQQPPAQPSVGQPQPPQWQQPPAQPTWGQPQQPPQPPQPQWPGQQPPQQAWQQPPAQPSWGQPAASGWGDAAAQFVGGRSTAVTIAGILLMLMSVFPALIGVVFLLLGNSSDLIDQAATQFGNSGLDVTRQAIRDAIVIIGVIFTGFGLFGVFGGLGMALRRTWGRVLAFLVSCLGTLFGLLFLVGALGARGSASGQGGSLVIALVIFAVYAFALVMTLIGGKHFRRG